MWGNIAAYIFVLCRGIEGRFIESSAGSDFDGTPVEGFRAPVSLFTKLKVAYGPASMPPSLASVFFVMRRSVTIVDHFQNSVWQL
uniref:Uncharacterized protein n=1 Tax=Ixodes ricinus TaxID=34613 RepID=A0A6B0U832_IXORI